MNNCKKCEEETANPKFCSRSCAASYTNSITPKRKRSGSCKKCSTTILRGRTYCKSCWVNLDKALTLEESIYKNHHRSSAYALVRSRARHSVKDRLQVCAVCGYSKHVECCHVKAISEFDVATLVSEINRAENLILLCRNCHWEFDKGSLKI